MNTENFQSSEVESKPQVIMARKNLFERIIHLIFSHKEQLFDAFKISLFCIAILIMNVFIYQQSYKRFYDSQLEKMWYEKTLSNKSFSGLWDGEDLYYQVMLKGVVSQVNRSTFLLKADQNEKELNSSLAYQASSSATVAEANKEILINWINGKRLIPEILQTGDHVVVFMHSYTPKDPLLVNKIIKIQ